MKTGRAREGIALSKKVFCAIGLTVFNLEKARPTSPLDWVSWTKEAETAVASSMACLVTVAPPISTVSVPTLPAAPDPSP